MQLIFDPEKMTLPAEDMLFVIEKIFSASRLRPKDLQSLQVKNKGMASFTTIRVACVIANAFAYALHIPVNGRKQIHPVYGREPNIT